MKEKLIEIRKNFEDAKAKADTSEALEQLRVAYLGKKSPLNDMFKELKSLSGEMKKTIAQDINTLKKEIEQYVETRSAELAQEDLKKRLAETERYDLTLPTDFGGGSLHPITLVQREVEDIFASMGFTIEDFREIVDDFDNFEAVNIPKHHPARDMQDTYFIDNGQLLKTHTSSAQNSIMRKYGAPLRAVFPGRCFRNEAIDACHENTFFQMEGMMIDENISISNLIYFMKTMLSEVFHRDIKVRLRPGFFPFVEPGFELDISCLICGGEGCPTCKHSGWLELCPCGMIHPNVLEL
ncbi:MAG: phenylalanine--tRNA ligase subunit alpha, partial [Clostridia bacterium]|nr:phenylalanine--tRNA ligase subunit alpha [Clostridia bacterium]